MPRTGVFGRALRVAALLMAVPAAAEITVDETAGRVTCSAGPGQWDSRVIESAAGGGWLAGRIRLLEPRSDCNWPAGAGFLFAIPGGRDVATGIQLGFDERDPDHLHIIVRLPGGYSRARVVGRVRADAAVPVSVRLADGHLQATVAGLSLRFRVRPRSRMEPMLMCNSGRFEFELADGMRLSSDRFRHEPD